MIVWSGHGYLVAIYAFVMSFVMELGVEGLMKNDEYYQTAGWPLATALFIAGALSWATGSALNKKSDDSGGSPRSHSLFFVPMQWWGPILAVIAVGVFVSRTLGGGGSP